MPFDEAHGRPFDKAQDRPFDKAQDRPFDKAQDRPFDKAQDREEESGWVREALAGDQEAFARLVENYQGSVYNLAYRMLGNARDAEDAAQETFLRAYSRLRSYDPARKFSSWLLAIAAHHCIDRLRRRRWTISLEDIPLGRKFSTGRDPEREIEREEEREEIRRLLERLPLDYRLVVILYYWNDLSCRQIGEVMGLGEGAVKSRLHRARRMLAQGLREERESASHRSSVAIGGAS